MAAKRYRKKAIICNFGTGGHTEQMKRLLSHLEVGELVLIAQSPTKPNDERFGEYSKVPKVRPEYASVFGILAIPFFAVAGMIETLKIMIRYDIRLLISTGPGGAIIPSFIVKLFGGKVIYFESWSRFTTPSIAGRIMYRIANVFFVQNDDVKKFYKNACFMGQL